MRSDEERFDNVKKLQNLIDRMEKIIRRDEE